jgi:16S rRNA (cytosine967-C5)-methyltransferase
LPAAGAAPEATHTAERARARLTAYRLLEVERRPEELAALDIALSNLPSGTSPAGRLAVAESLPDWLAERLTADLGLPRATQLARALSERAPLTVRANRLKADRTTLQARLRQEGIETAPTTHAPDGLHLVTRCNTFGLAAFQEGLFEVQDEASQLCCQVVDPHPGWRVVDACAGAGGKSLALAAIMKNKGQLIALDVAEHRLEELRRRARRAGAHNLRAVLIPREGALPPEVQALAGQADAVLCDAPCSGTGALRRNPDARYRYNETDIQRFARVQLDILDRMSLLVAPGGLLVYATCSLLRDENEDVISAFLSRNEGFACEPTAGGLGQTLAGALGAVEFLKTAPDLHGADGFFAARLRRRS